MKISDRDKKIIVILVIACIIALPILFIIKPCKEKTDSLNGEIATLTERFNYLYDLEQQKPFFLSEIGRLNSERDSIIMSYAKGIDQVNTIMFLRGLELDLPVIMTTETYGEHIETMISEGTVNEEGKIVGDLQAVSASTSVRYICEYSQLKQIIDTLYANKEKMTVPSINMSYDPETGLIEGEFVLNEFAITGTGRDMSPAVIPAMPHGNESIFAYKLPVIEEEDLADAAASDDEETEEEEE